MYFFIQNGGFSMAMLDYRRVPPAPKKTARIGHPKIPVYQIVGLEKSPSSSPSFFLLRPDGLNYQRQVMTYDLEIMVIHPLGKVAK